MRGGGGGGLGGGGSQDSLELTEDVSKGAAKENAGKIAVAIVELGIYSAAFHHTKQGLKHITKDRKYAAHLYVFSIRES